MAKRSKTLKKPAVKFVAPTKSNSGEGFIVEDRVFQRLTRGFGKSVVVGFVGTKANE